MTKQYDLLAEAATLLSTYTHIYLESTSPLTDSSRFHTPFHDPTQHAT